MKKDRQEEVVEEEEEYDDDEDEDQEGYDENEQEEEKHLGHRPYSSSSSPPFCLHLSCNHNPRLSSLHVCWLIWDRVIVQSFKSPHRLCFC